MFQIVIVSRDPSHVLFDNFLWCVADEEVESKNEHTEVVELPEDGDEVRDDVDREHEIAGDRGEDQLLLRRYARVARECPDEACVRRHLAQRLDRLLWIAGRTKSSSHRAPPPAGIVPAGPRRPRITLCHARPSKT